VTYGEESDYRASVKATKFNIKALVKLWPFFLIILMAALAVWMAYKYLDTRSAEMEERLTDQAAKSKTVVVVPVRDLMEGEVLDLATLATREVPREYVNADALTQESVGPYLGRKLTQAVTKGTPLLASFIASYDFKPFSSTLDPGTRAITIPVDDINSVSGMLTAGDKIDLLLLTQDAGSQSGMASNMQLIPLLEEVVVRATGTTTQRDLLSQAQNGAPRNPNRPAGSYTTITIAIHPREAQKIVLAQQAGRIIALLRRPDDAALYSERLTSKELFGNPEPTNTPTLPPRTVSYIIGGSFKTGGQGVRSSTGQAPKDADPQALKQLMQLMQAGGGGK
jgi:pilus assembly protein CpaB